MFECEQSANKVTSHLTVSSTVIMGPFTGSRGLKQSLFALVQTRHSQVTLKTSSSYCKKDGF